MDRLSSQGDTIGYGSQDEEMTAVFEDSPGSNDDEEGAQRIGKSAAAYIRRGKKILTNDMWNVVVCDECHHIKSFGTRANELVRKLDRETLLLVSATPLPNHKGDATNADTFFGDLVYDSLFDESVELEVEEPLTLNRVLRGRVKKTSQLSPRERRRAMEYKSAVYRRSSLASTDVNNVKLTNPSARLLQRLSDLQQGALDMDASGRPEYQRCKEARKARSNPILAAGHKEVDRVALFDTTGGLQWNFYNTRESQKLGFPPDRVNQVRYVARDSPKYVYTVLEALDAQAKGERLLVYVNNPLASQMVNALLVAAGVPTLHYMSRHSQTERDHAVEAFNNPATPYICLVTSLQLSAFGVNLHQACHRGLILEQPISQAILLQAQGRLWRIGQKHDVHWKILYSRDSFDCFIEAYNLEKYATSLAAESGIDPRIKGEARAICAFDIMRQHLGQSCSRYSRGRVVWSQMDSRELELEGFFYSALAQYFFKYPGKSDLVGKHNVKHIAKAWEIGLEITPRMVGSPTPLDDGLVLDGYKEADDENTAPRKTIPHGGRGVEGTDIGD
ncbi:uncharacterized protein Triagg1_2030 [Trichoderma aggressivum f. europaeum]|uniref:Helicase C-terminal domain-containing protein n=1 Tax=Trichoderma aggressivum f. europaeum TaxID=173218 RepID=A0AAE1M8A0_9HYPO|nr:hypothetical protein Triagg1_2030 [Trichoderma aggressivum f. europaeum]